ncbi:type II secretion system protein GspM [Immundisolibacter sp.]
MKLEVSPWQGRIAAVVLLFGVFFAAGVMVYLPYQKLHQRYDARIDELLQHIGRYRGIAGTRPVIEANIARLKKLDPGRFYLKASAPALAAAEVQQMAMNAIEPNQLQVESTQIAAHKDDGTRRKVTVNFRLRGPLPAVHKALYQLETAVPYLFLDNLVIRSTVTRNYRPVPGVEPDVSVQFDLSGYARIVKPAEKKS